MSTTILSIESSCDETAAAIVVDGREVKSNIIYSQIELHKLYGGVVPEIASRKHVEKVNQVIRAAIEEAHVTWTGRCTSGWCECGKGGCLCKEETAGWCASYRGTHCGELY